jgi:hypothetical protein
VSFTLHPGPQYGGGRSNAVRAALRRRGGPLLLTVSIGGDLVAPYGFGERDWVNVLFGDGADLGRVLVARCDAGRKGTGYQLLRRNRGGSLSVCAATLPAGPLLDADGLRWRLSLVQQPSAVCEHGMTARGLVVTLPAEWWQDLDAEARAMRRATRDEIAAMDERRRRRLRAEPAPVTGRRVA